MSPSVLKCPGTPSVPECPQVSRYTKCPRVSSSVPVHQVPPSVLKCPGTPSVPECPQVSRFKLIPDCTLSVKACFFCQLRVSGGLGPWTWMVPQVPVEGSRWFRSRKRKGFSRRVWEGVAEGSSRGLLLKVKIPVSRFQLMFQGPNRVPDTVLGCQQVTKVPDKFPMGIQMHPNRVATRVPDKVRNRVVDRAIGFLIRFPIGFPKNFFETYLLLGIFFGLIS